MKRSAIAILVTLLSALVACGGSNSNMDNVNGNWSAALTDTSAGMQFAFTTNLTQGSGNNLNIVNFKFTTEGSCFTTPTTQTGSFVLAGNFNGKVTGQFQMTVSTQFPSDNNVLTLNGEVSGNAITGTWTLAGGSGCTGGGAFTMNRG